jgi:uncharacterized protein YyaL (SSP411 family)
MLGFTYAPRSELRTILARVATVWGEKAGELVDLARRAARERAAEPGTGKANASASVSPTQLQDDFKRRALLFGDQLAGGFGDQSRFPMAPHLAALLELQARAPDPELGAFLVVTLDAVADKALRDHLGGGFFRYTVDPDWQTPHFEKMLYTQALLVPLLLRAAEVLQKPVYREVARQTLSFLLSDMQERDGAFVASLSAVDGEGAEGGYYLWHTEELERLLTADERNVLGMVWGLEGPPHHGAGLLPMPKRDLEQAAGELGIETDEAARFMSEARSKLLAARSGRTLPRDEKRLAGWNGLVLSALVAGSRAFGDDTYRRAASGLRDFLVTRLWDGNQLHRAVSAGRPAGEATLEDYALVAQGLKDWADLTHAAQDLALAVRLIGAAWERFYQDGGWRLSAEPLLPAIPADLALTASPLPSPDAVLVALSLDGGDSPLPGMAHSALERSLPLVTANPFAYPQHTLLLIDQASR